ncbi:Caveolin [Ancylostoma duodenale]|uniref:Caveolin n=1 Tax=Ancylostoma duodenale TaxID=51022 RepID=A0A0C2H072_9BILA|nr:Caveolin [Ancylostoma duodenale]
MTTSDLDLRIFSEKQTLSTHGTVSGDWSTRFSRKWTRLFVYRLCSLIIGLPAAIIFGILFAIASVINVFACVPIAKLLSIPANWLAKTWCWLVHAVVDPVATALGLLFSSFTIRKYGINSQPTDPCVA